MTDQEINEAVAVRLGFKKIESSPPHPTCGSRWIGPDESDAYGIPDFCHSIAAAWEIIQAFDKTVDVCYCPAIIEDGDWHCAVGVTEDANADPNDPEVDVWASTAPMAICLAFLKLK